MNKILQWDTEIFLWLNSLGTKTWDSFWSYLSETEVWFPFYGVLAILLFVVFKIKKAILALFLIILNVLLTDQGSTWIFKERFLRLRPCHEEALIDQMRLVEGCGGQYGFLSAHAANTFGLAILAGLVFREKYKWMLPVLLMWALVVSYSRIYLGVHYPLDIIAGALYGSLCGYLLYRVFLVTQLRLV